jgi:hypothetical protein
MHGVIAAAMWPTGSSAATANRKLVYAAVAGVDRSVVGQGGGRQAVGCRGVGEAGHDVAAADSTESGAVEQISRMVIEPVEDLDVAAIGQGPVGEV